MVVRGVGLPVSGPMLAMGTADKIGAGPALTAVLVILTGAIMVTPLMNARHLKNYAARGFAGIALGLNGLLTALLEPVLIHWLAG